MLPGRVLPPSFPTEEWGASPCLLAKSSQGGGVTEDTRGQRTSQCRSGGEGTERRQPPYRCSPWVQVKALPTVPSAGEWLVPA